MSATLRHRISILSCDILDERSSQHQNCNPRKQRLNNERAQSATKRKHQSMSQWNSQNDDVFVAEYAQPPFGSKHTRNSGLSCGVVVILLLGLFAFLLLVGGVMVYMAQKDNAKVNEPDATQYMGSVEERVRKDLSQAKQASLFTNPASLHPRYGDFEQLIAAAEEAFDDTSNLKTDRLIDANRHADIKIQALRKKGYKKYELTGCREAFAQNISGPTPFDSAEITKIESLNEDDFQLFITLDTGYGPEPVVWWVTSQNGRLLLYDWSQLELGLRDTDERVEIIDGTVKGRNDGYEKYSDLCYEYLDTYDSELGYAEQRAKRCKILKQMERITVPRKLVPSVKLIIAKRWASEGEHAEALRMFKSMGDMSQTPGWYKLAGNAYFEQNDFFTAAQHYQKYRQILGDERIVLQQLATCYQQSGDVEAERDTRLLSVRFMTTYNSGLLRLLSLVDEAKSAEILENVRARQGDELLISTLSTAKANPYYWTELRQIKDYLIAVTPKSRVATISQLYEAQTRDDSQIDPQWLLTALNCDEDQDAAFSNYELWFQITETSPQDLLRIFQETGCSKDNFKIIQEIYNYEGIIDDELMLRIADTAKKEHPQWYLPYLITGVLKREQDQPEAALESANKALDLFEKFEDANDDENDETDLSYHENWISGLRLWALYEMGEQKQARELAIAKDLVASLISLKNDAKDFDGLDKLLSEFDSENPLYVLELARRTYRNGEPEQAIEQLAKHINKLDSESTNPYDRSTAEYQLDQWCSELDNPLKLFELCPSAARFNRAFRDLLDQKRWEECEQALRRAAKQLSEDELLPSKIRLAWAQKDYRNVRALAWRRKSLGNGYDIQDCYRQIVRSAIRSDKPDIAMSIALEAKEKFSDEMIALVAAIAVDKIDVAKPLLSACDEYDLANLINDEDAGAKLIQAVRKKRMRIGHVSMGYAGNRNYSKAALLTKSPLITELPQIETALSESGLKAIGKVDKLEDQKPGVEAWRSISDGREVWFVQSRLAPPDEPDLTDAQKKAGVTQAEYILSIVVFEPAVGNEQQADNESGALARTITAQFVSDQCLAFESEYNWVSVDQLRNESGSLKSDSQIVDALAQTDWSYYPPKSHGALKEKDAQRFQENLGNAARMFEKGQIDAFSVSTPIEVEGAQQLVTMQVDSIEVADYTVSFIGMIEPNSLLDSRIVEEVKYSISLNSVIEFSYSKSRAPQDRSKQSFRKTWNQETN